MMARTPRVAIIAGLAAAVAMHRRGIEATVYDQARGIKRDRCRVQMIPNQINALRSPGLEVSATAVSFELESQYE